MENRSTVSPAPTPNIITASHNGSGPSSAANVKMADILVSDNAYLLVSYVILRCGAQVVLRLAGTCANIINIIVFTRSGPLDSVTSGFLALAVVDLGYLTLHLIPITLGILENSFRVDSPVDLSSLSFVISMYPLMFGDMSFLITCYLAVQKACCVVIPFRFKHVFTRGRSIAVVLTIIIVVALYYTPIFVTMIRDMRPFYSRQTNKTSILIMLSPTGRDLLRMFRVVNKTCLPIMTQSVVLICLVLLTVHLKRSSNFRRAFHSKTSSVKNTGEPDKNDVKGLRAIQSVTAVAAIFVASNLPDICINIASLQIPEFNDRRYFHNLYWVVEDCSNIMPIVNSSIHILVYLRFNSSYRRQFRQLFTPRRLKA